LHRAVKTVNLLISLSVCKEKLWQTYLQRIQGYGKNNYLTVFGGMVLMKFYSNHDACTAGMCILVPFNKMNQK